MPMGVIGMLGASTLASWRSLGRSWDDPSTLEGTRKGLVCSLIGFDRFFFVILVIHSESFFDTVREKKHFFHIYSQLAFSVCF